MIFVAWGPDKTCKSTLALTFPKPLAYLEFDIGGGERAIKNDSRYGFKQAVADSSIITSFKDPQGHEHPLSFVMPYQIGVVDFNKMSVRPSKILVGMKELWYKFLVAYISLLEQPNIQTIVIDTGTLLWELCCSGYLQEKQELQLDQYGNVLPGEKLRVQLLQIEYREPNIRMRGIVYQAKAHKKHLVMTHHERDEYGMMMIKGEMIQGPTGRKERAGWGSLGDGADIIVHTYIKSGSAKVPYCKVELAEIKELEGMEIETPTWEKIDFMLRMLRGEV